MEITRESKLGNIVTKIPKASEVFNAYKLDYCCGGYQTIEQACKEANVDVDKLLIKLNKLKKEVEQLGTKHDFENMNNSDLIEYIVNVHHSYLNEHLPLISEISNNVLRVHGSNHAELFDVHKLFHSLKSELEQHLIKEEVSLFPSMEENDDNKKLVNQIEDEHEVAGGILKELRLVTQNYSVPQDGCNSYKKLYSELEKLEKDIFSHIHLENNILHKRFN